jgi:hypothetical protein
VEEKENISLMAAKFSSEQATYLSLQYIELD